MKNINLFEIKREVFHILVGVLIVLGVLFVPHAEIIGFIVFIFGALISFLATQYNIPFITKCLCLFERDCNKKFPGKGVLFFFAGSLLVLQLFSRDIALASILILTFADPIAHFIGAGFGKIKSPVNKNKNIEGTFAGIVVGMIFASFFVSILQAFLGSLFAMTLELIGIAMGGENIDDNFIIPLVAGTIMHLISFV